MKKSEHAFWGGITATFLHIIKKAQYQRMPANSNELGMAFLGGCLGGILPDAIEPATNPNHRQCFHSAIALAIAGNEAAKPTTTPQELILRSILAGYASHCLADATTPKSIPLI